MMAWILVSVLYCGAFCFLFLYVLKCILLKNIYLIDVFNVFQ
jgi:hypothetical protein